MNWLSVNRLSSMKGVCGAAATFGAHIKKVTLRRVSNSQQGVKDNIVAALLTGHALIGTLTVIGVGHFGLRPAHS